MSFLLSFRPFSLSVHAPRAAGASSRIITAAHTRSLASLSSKDGNDQYYKGTGAVKGGSLNSKGRFIVDPLKRKYIQMPDLTGFELKPYVSKAIRNRPAGALAKTKVAQPKSVAQVMAGGSRVALFTRRNGTEPWAPRARSKPAPAAASPPSASP
jgi:hypothetical protein